MNGHQKPMQAGELHRLHGFLLKRCYRPIGTFPFPGALQRGVVHHRQAARVVTAIHLDIFVYRYKFLSLTYDKNLYLFSMSDKILNQFVVELPWKNGITSIRERDRFGDNGQPRRACRIVFGSKWHGGCRYK
jgi:hypothetical protein